MLDRINKGVGDSNSIFDRPSLLDKLHSRGSILDKLDHSAPENGLSLDNKGGLLSDLFDDDGNISLPATGSHQTTLDTSGCCTHVIRWSAHLYGA